MPEFHLTPNPTIGPTVCLFCGTGGNLIDTCTEIYGHGRVYICAGHPGSSGCAAQIAILTGWVDPEVNEITGLELVAAKDLISELQAKLASKKVSMTLGEVQELMEHAGT